MVALPITCERLNVTTNVRKERLRAWSLLLVAATVRSFAHMPLGISDRSTVQICVRSVYVAIPPHGLYFAHFWTSTFDNPVILPNKYCFDFSISLVYSKQAKLLKRPKDVVLHFAVELQSCCVDKRSKSWKTPHEILRNAFLSEPIFKAVKSLASTYAGILRMLLG